MPRSNNFKSIFAVPNQSIRRVHAPGLLIIDREKFTQRDNSEKDYTGKLVAEKCFGKSVLPVDTHVHRVSQRIGLIGSKVNPTAAHALLLNLLPPDPHVLFNFHISMLLHGQKICIWGTPRCEKCPLTDPCDWYQSHYGGLDKQQRSAKR